jgi:hypothetical protein
MHLVTRSAGSLATLALSAASLSAVALSAVAQQPTVHGTRFQASRAVSQVAVGDAKLVEQLATGSRSAVSLASGDFFEGSGKSLVTGYAFGQGGVIAAQKSTLLDSANGAAGSPFSATAQFADVGMRPDFLQSADLNGDGHQDLIVAARGGSSIATLLGNGKGGFTLQPAFSAGGRITALTAWQNPSSGAELLAVGVCGTTCSVSILQADGTVVASVPLAGEPVILEAARLNRSGAEDLLVGGSAGLVVVDGRTVLSSAPKTDTLPVSGAVAATTGGFVYDHRGMPQVAVLTADGSIHTFARTGIVSTPPPAPAGARPTRLQLMARLKALTPPNPDGLPWSEVETLDGVAPSSGQAHPLLVRARASGSGEDDLLVLNANGGQITTIGHPVVAVPATEGQSAGSLRVLPARIETEGSSTDAVQAALPMRLGQDARTGLVTASSGAQPEINPLGTYHTYVVTSSADGAPNPGNCHNNNSPASNNCTLRSAIAAANADSSYNEAHGTADTITIPAGTYTLTYNTGLDQDGNSTYHIEITGPVNLEGAGSAFTAITTANKDKIFSINSGFANNGSVPQSIFDTYISGLTLTNATNTDDPFNASQAFSDSTGGILDYESLGQGYLTIANSVISNGTDLHGPGGGIYASDGLIFNGSAPTYGPGTLELDNCTVSGNRSAENGGGISTFGNIPIILSATTITSNTSSVTLGGSEDQQGTGYGGGVFFNTDTASGVESQISSSTFSNNAASDNTAGGNPHGAGLDAETGLKITNSQFTGNTLTTGSGGADGGAIHLQATTYAPLLTGLTVTGNTAQLGGGLYIDSEGTGGVSKPVTLQYSLITGNTASGSGKGLYVGDATGSSAVNATEDFWGCNTGPSASPCDTAANNGTTSQLVTSPYAVVTALVNTATPSVNTTLTLTGALNSDSASTAFPSADLTAFEGLSASLVLSQNNFIVTSTTVNTNNTNASASLSHTFSAGGAGMGTVTIDNATATATFTVPSPVTLSQAFGASSVPLGQFTTLTFTITNPNASAQTGIAFSDTLPSGLYDQPGSTQTCGGTLTTSVSGISLSGGTLAANASCSIQVPIGSSAAGVQTNTTGTISSTEAGTGSTSTASITVVAPSGVTAAFTSSQVVAGGIATIVFTLTNPNSASDLTGVSLTSNEPSGFSFEGASTNCSGASFSSTSTSYTLTGGSIPASSSCTFSVFYKAGGTPGTYTDTSGNVTSTNGGTGSTASASVNVVAVPTLTLTGPAAVNRGATGPTVTATYTVTSGSLAPTAQFSLYDGTTLLSSVTATQTSATTYTATFSTATIPSDSQTITAQYPGDANYPKVTSNSVTIEVIANNIWIGNPKFFKTSALQYNGTALLSTPESTGGTGVAIDSLGNVWSLNASEFNLAEFSSTGAVVSSGYSGGGLFGPTSLAIDGAGQVWVTNSSTSISAFANNGLALSPGTTGYTGGNLSNPTGISIDISGNVWIANQGNNSVTEVLGAAVPVVPLAIGVANNTTGSKP